MEDRAIGRRVGATLVGGDFLAAQDDLGPKQWPSFVRVATTLPRTETFKVIKRMLSAEALDCDDQVFEIAR